MACCTVALTLAAVPVLPADDEFPIEAVTAPASQIFQVGGSSAFSCNIDNLYAQFADLTLTFPLAAPAPVVILYKVSGTILAGTGYIAIRVIVDAVEEPALRDISGDTVYFSNDGTWVRTLAAGSHTVTVQYLTSNGCTNDPGLGTFATRKLMAIVYTGP